MSLVQIALAAEELFRQQPDIQFTPTQCVRSRQLRAACDRCAALCPTGAITLDAGLPELDVEHCIKCGVCLHACPVGAFAHADGLYPLLNCAERMVEHETLDIVCAHHPAAAQADRAVDGVIQIGNCLSECGPSAYIGLRAVGVKQVRVRLEVCDTCPLRVLQPQIEQSVSQARRILSAFGLDDGLTVVHDASADWRKRPVFQSTNPPVSRRSFLTMFAAGATSRARAIAADDEGMPGRERQRLVQALRLLVEPEQVPADAALDTDGFVQLAVRETCTACGVCERVCPVGALHIEKSEKAFALFFAPQRCTNCGLCVETCEPDALVAVGHPPAADVLNGVVQQLRAGALRRCQHCQTLFASQTDDDLCDVCRHRRDVPFGGLPPDAVLAKLPPAARARLERLRTPPDRSHD